MFIANPPRIDVLAGTGHAKDVASTASPSLPLPTLHEQRQLTQGLVSTGTHHLG